MENLFSLRNILQAGGFTIEILIASSILVVAVIIERTYLYLKFEMEFRRFKEGLANPEVKEDTPLISSLIRDTDYHNLDEVKRERLHFLNITTISLCLNKHLSILATVGSVAPFIGLFGTVIGIIKAFKKLSIEKGAGIEVVGGGIAEALICTAAGLLVAIISVIFYNIAKTRVKKIIDEFDIIEAGI